MIRGLCGSMHPGEIRSLVTWFRCTTQRFDARSRIETPGVKWNEPSRLPLLILVVMMMLKSKLPPDA